METVTACLITWKRQENIPLIVAELLKHEFIDEILIWDNSKTENIINEARYELAKRAKNEVIYVQDDDWLIKNIPDLYQAHLGAPSTLINGGIPDYLRVVPENIYGSSQMSIVGWGTIFDRRWIDVLHRYTDSYGKDSCYFRETDRIFTMLLNRHHKMVRVDAQELPGARNEHALSQQADHLSMKQQAIEKCRKILGV